jgi:hypothetical protein
MASIRDQLLAAVVTALSASGKPAGVAVDRSRGTPLSPGQLPRMIVYPIHERVTTERAMRTADGAKSGHSMRTLRVRLECRVSVGPDGQTDTTLDPLVTWAVKGLMADARLGGLCHDIHEKETQWLPPSAGERDAAYGAAAVDVEIEYHTAANDPSVKP